MRSFVSGIIIVEIIKTDFVVSLRHLCTNPLSDVPSLFLVHKGKVLRSPGVSHQDAGWKVLQCSQEALIDQHANLGSMHCSWFASNNSFTLSSLLFPKCNILRRFALNKLITLVEMILRTNWPYKQLLVKVLRCSNFGF